MKLQLRHLQQVVALAEEGNYRKAAARLGLSQPALSRGIQTLEAALGTRLFDRTSRGVQPTQIGQLVLERGRSLLAGASDLENEIRMALGLEAGALAVGAGPYAAEISVGPACGRLQREHPGLNLDVRVGDWEFLTILVLAGEVDVAVAELSIAAANDRLTTEALPRHPGRFVCHAGHALTRQKRPTLEDVLSYPLVSPALPARFGGVKPDVRVDTFALARNVLLEGTAVGLTTLPQLAADLEQGLVHLPVEAPWLHTSYGFIRLKRRTPSPAALAFMEVVREIEAGLAAGTARGAGLPEPGSQAERSGFTGASRR
ncbi:MAG: LysR family transcriptional regulator [Anaerolineae bacterium]